MGGWGFTIVYDNFLSDRFLAMTVGWLVMMVVMTEEARSVDRMSNTFSYSLNSAAETVVVAVVVVIAHITSVLWWVDCRSSSPLFDANFCVSAWEIRSWTSETRSLLTVVLLRSSEALFGSTSYNWAGAFTELTLGNVKGRVEAAGSNTNTTYRIEVTVVSGILDADLGVNVFLIRLLVSLSGYVNAAGNAVSGVFSFLVVDVNFLTYSTVVRVLFAGAEFLLESSLLAIKSIRGLSGVAGFVTFPSDARSLIR